LRAADQQAQHEAASLRAAYSASQRSALLPRLALAGGWCSSSEWLRLCPLGLLAAAYCCNALHRVAASQVQSLTYGCPRVGNHAWKRAHNKMVPDAFDVIHTNDVVSARQPGVRSRALVGPPAPAPEAVPRASLLPRPQVVNAAKFITIYKRTGHRRASAGSARPFSGHALLFSPPAPAISPTHPPAYTHALRLLPFGACAPCGCGCGQAVPLPCSLRLGFQESTRPAMPTTPAWPAAG
jgi:hypothetical protein